MFAPHVRELAAKLDVMQCVAALAGYRVYYKFWDRRAYHVSLKAYGAKMPAVVRLH